MTNDDQTNQLEADIIEQTRFAQEEPILEDSRYGQKKSAPVAPVPPAATPVPAGAGAPMAGQVANAGAPSSPSTPTSPTGVPTPNTATPSVSSATIANTPLATVTPTAPGSLPVTSPSAPPGMTAIPTKLIKTAGIVLVILLVLLVGIAAMSRRPSTVKPSVQPSATPTSVSQTEMEKRVTELQKQLESADPTKQDLVFPPVDMQIRLDKKTN